MDKLTTALQSYDQSVEKSYPIIPGEIGITLGGRRLTEVVGRGQFVYVRLRSNASEIIQVFNGKVFPGYGLPVLVTWNNNRYEIIGVDIQRYQQWMADNPHIAKHGATHSMDKEGGRLGTDPVWVYPYQFMPSLVTPFPQSGIQNVYINPLTVQSNGEWKYIGNTGTSNLVPYSPISGSSIVLISLDSRTGNPSLLATTGTYIPSSITGTSELLSYLPIVDLGRYIPLSFVLLYSGTSSISWNSLFDVRQFFTSQSTGSSYLQVNGIYPVDSITTTGANFSYSGTSAFLEFIGSGGGGSSAIRMSIDGTLETGTSMAHPYLVTDAYTPEYAYLYIDYLGITGTTRVDVTKNGLSIFTGGYTLSLPHYSTGSWMRTTLPSSTTLARGDLLNVNILEKSQNARDMDVVLVSSSSGASSITVGTVDGNPSVSEVSTMLFPSGTVVDNGGGQVTIIYNSAELDYVQVTGSVSPTATTEATANTLVSSSSIAYDGNTIIVVEFFAGNARPDITAAGRSLTFYLYQDGTSIGLLGFISTPAAGAANVPISLRRRFKPTAGTHSYSVRASVSAGTGLVSAGAGTIGNPTPMYLRITRA